MNKSIEKIRDIKALINEVYDDRKCQGELTEGARKSWLCFKQYCDDIKQDLGAYEQLKQDHDKTLSNNGELVVKVADLQKENQELIVNKNVAQAVALNQKREIGELKDQIAYFKEESENWQSAYEWSQAQNAILKLRIKELEEVKNEN